MGQIKDETLKEILSISLAHNKLKMIEKWNFSHNASLEKKWWWKL